MWHRGDRTGDVRKLPRKGSRTDNSDLTCRFTPIAEMLVDTVPQHAEIFTYLRGTRAEHVGFLCRITRGRPMHSLQLRTCLFLVAHAGIVLAVLLLV